MKKLSLLLLMLLLINILIFTHCSKESNQKQQVSGKFNMDTLTFGHSIKGWELYSWSEGNNWNYSILIGTNRLKSYEEVVTNKIKVSGVDSLKMMFDKFPENENIYWIGRGWLEKIWVNDIQNLSLPDESIINEIKDYCTLNKLSLIVGK